MKKDNDIDPAFAILMDINKVDVSAQIAGDGVELPGKKQERNKGEHKETTRGEKKKTAKQPVTDSPASTPASFKEKSRVYPIFVKTSTLNRFRAACLVFNPARAGKSNSDFLDVLLETYINSMTDKNRKLYEFLLQQK